MFLTFTSLITNEVQELFSSVDCGPLTVNDLLVFLTHFLINYIDLHVTYHICDSVFSPKVINCPVFLKVVF